MVILIIIKFLLFVYLLVGLKKAHLVKIIAQKDLKEDQYLSIFSYFKVLLFWGLKKRGQDWKFPIKKRS